MDFALYFPYNYPPFALFFYKKCPLFCPLFLSFCPLWIIGQYASVLLLCSPQAADSSNSVTCDEDIAAMNLFICLVARYFDQGDLVDTDES